MYWYSCINSCINCISQKQHGNPERGLLRNSRVEATCLFPAPRFYSFVAICCYKNIVRHIQEKLPALSSFLKSLDRHHLSTFLYLYALGQGLEIQTYCAGTTKAWASRVRHGWPMVLCFTWDKSHQLRQTKFTPCRRSEYLFEMFVLCCCSNIWDLLKLD